MTSLFTFSNWFTFPGITFQFVSLICKQWKVQENTKNIANTCMYYPEFKILLTFDDSQGTKDVLVILLTVSLTSCKASQKLHSGNHWWNVFRLPLKLLVECVVGSASSQFVALGFSEQN